MFVFFREEKKKIYKDPYLPHIDFFIWNTIHFYLYIQRGCSINDFGDKVTLCNCGVIAPWTSWRCFWLHNHASQGKAAASVTTGTCVSSERKGTCRPASSWRAREQSMNPTHQRGDSYLRVRNLGMVSGGRWRPLCHMTDTERLFRGEGSLKASVMWQTHRGMVHRQVATFLSFHFSAFSFPELLTWNSLIMHMGLF